MANARRRVITRNFVNDAKFNASKFPRSGFNLGYQTKMTGQIGRIWIPTYQHLQPKDSFAGSMAGSFTFNKLVTPVAPELNAHVYVFQCRHRSVDSDYEETMNPNEINNYGNGLHFPMFSPSKVCESLIPNCTQALNLDDAEDIVQFFGWYLSNNLTDWVDYLTNSLQLANESDYKAYVNSISTPYPNAIQQDMEKAFRDDYRSDLLAYIKSFLPETLVAAKTMDGLYGFIRACLAFPMQIWGQDSFADQLGYPVMRLLPLHMKKNPSFTFSNMTDVVHYLMFDGQKWTRPVGSSASVSADPLMCNEYPFRHILSIWVEYLRNVHLEKRASWMKYKALTSVSILNKFATTAYASIPADDRIRFWAMCAPLSAYYAEDLVTSAQTDAAFKHVYAPMFAQSTGSASGSPIVSLQGTSGTTVTPTIGSVQQIVTPASQATQKTEMAHNTLSNVAISYMQPSGTQVSVNCPIPSNVNNFLQQAYGTTTAAAVIQDFGIVRTMHNVENYLKRKYYFGDEYQDEMLAQHDVSLSDTALLKPKLIAGGTNLVSDSQMISTNGADPNGGSAAVADIGTRVAKQEGTLPNVNYSGFADENGMLISLAWILPTAHYDPACVQNYARGYLDFPLPVMASSNECIINNVDFSRTQNYVKPFGHAPYMVHWRTRLNEIHGDFLDSKVDWFCNRFFENGSATPVLQYRTLRTSNLTLGMYQDNILFDGQWWLLATHQFHVMRQLPANVEYA